MAMKAHESVLPPSANWYYSQICAWGYEAERLLLAFGAKNSVFLYQVRGVSAAPLLAQHLNTNVGCRSHSEATVRTNAAPHSWRSYLEAQRTSA